MDLTPKGESYLQGLNLFKKKNKAESEKLQKRLWHGDNNQIGYSVQEEEPGEIYGLYDPKGKFVNSFRTQDAEWADSIIREAQDLKDEGYSDQAVDALVSARRITHNGFEFLMSGIRQIEEIYEKEGKSLPVVAVNVDGKRIDVNLKEALAMMGDMRGYYMPRIRRSGRYMLKAKKKGANPILEFFDYKTTIASRQTELEKQGYKVEKDLSPKMPEDIFEMAGEIVAMQATINEALNKARSELDETGKISSDLQGLIRSTESLFAKAVTEQIANIIKGRGHRAHMIKRQQAKGVDVWKGYEEDYVLALGKYVRGIAAGEAKKVMSLKLVQHFTGTDESFEQWESRREAAGEDTDYEFYLEEVEQKRVDPIKQPNAFKEGKSYMEDMLRNDEFIDRFIGTIKGVAVLKYLAGRVSAPVVNLTAMVTSAPATMNGIAGIPLNKTFKLIGKGFNNYKKFRSGKKLDEWTQKMYEELEDQGWHKAQYNKEALSVLQSKVGLGWSNLIEYSMFAFGLSEQYNRAGTISATYMGLKSKKETWTQKDHNEAMNIAKEVSDKAHGVYGKANRPHFARGGNVGAQIAQAFYVFKTFSHNYLLTMKELGFDRKNAKATLFMALSPAILAGTGASVLTPLIVKTLALLGIGGDDPEETFYDWVAENVGEGASQTARYGMVGVAGKGVSLKGSLAIGVFDVPTKLSDIVGAPGSVISDVYMGGENLIKGNISKGIEKALPSALGSTFRAVRERTEGVTTRTNAPVFFGKKQLKADNIDAILRFLSFNPAKIAKAREKKWKERKLEYKYRDMRTDIYTKLKKFYLQPKAKRKKDKYLDILQDIRQYNERVKSRELTRFIPLITKQSIKSNLKRSFRPDKKERRRK
jgi:hypothetical protein